MRVRAALDHSGWKIPPRKVTVNLAPADVRKDGAAFDLPIAVGVLAAQEHRPAPGARGHADAGGAVSRRQLAARRGRPADRAVRAGARARGDDPAARLRRRGGGDPRGAGAGGVVAAGGRGLSARRARAAARRRASAVERHVAGDADLADVRGLEYVKLALEVAAAGSHNLLLIGAPGSGKSMLARRLPTILPPLDDDEALETSMIYSAAGKLDGASLIRVPTVSRAAPGRLGGGAGRRRLRCAEAGRDQPGAQRRALPRRAARVQADGARGAAPAARGARASPSCARGTPIEFPASFALVAAMNPCPCGYYGSALRNCICDAGQGAPLPRPPLRPAARSPRSAGRGAAGRLPGAHRRARQASRRRACASACSRRARSSGDASPALRLHANAQMGSRQIASLVPTRR